MSSRWLLFVPLLMSWQGFGQTSPPRLYQPIVSPAAIEVNTLKTINVSVRIAAYQRIIPSTVSLMRVTEARQIMSTLALLNDSGSNGDAVAGDGKFSSNIGIRELIVGKLYFQVSAAALGQLQRVTSPIVSMDITPLGFPNSPSLAPPPTVIDSTTQATIACNQVSVTFISSTPFSSIAALVNSIGGQIIGRFPELGVYQIGIPGCSITNLNQTLLFLRASSLVATADTRPVTAALHQTSQAPNDPLYSQQWNLTNIGLPMAWQSRNNGVPIAILDSGINYHHEDLRGSVELGPNFGDIADGNHDPIDTYHHGTVVASIAAARTNNNLGMAGVAFSASLIAIKITRLNQNSVDSDVAAAAILYAVGVKHAGVINASFGFSPIHGSLASLRNAVRYAIDAGAVVVASAGNANESIPSFPAAYSGVISVGSIDNANARSSFSNYGSSVDVYAPGSSILGARFDVDTGSQAYSSGNDGTSFSAPHVSGIVSMMLAANDALGPAEVERLISCTADDIGGAPDGSRIRRINAGKAVSYASVGATSCDGPLMIDATLDGAAWTGPVSFEVIGSAYGVIGASVPSGPFSAPFGMYRAKYISGLPPNSMFIGISPCALTSPASNVCDQMLNPGQSLRLTFRFKTKLPLAGFTMTAGAQSATEGQTLSVTVPSGGSVNVAFDSSRSAAFNGATITARQWRVGSMVVATTATFSRSFVIGSYTISLVVTDSRGAQSTAAQGTIVVTQSSPSSALDDDFNGGSIDTNKWDVVIVPFGAGTITAANQRAEMMRTAAPGTTTYQGLQSRCKLSGNFDVQVDFALLSWPPQNFHTVRFAAQDLPQGSVGHVGIYRNSYNAEGYQMRTIGGVISDVPVSDTSGKLRLVRTGSTITGYYWNSSEFVLLASSPTTTVDTGFLLDFSNPLTTAPAGVKIAFDNFKVNSGTISSCR